ncbi:MAG TPA: RNA methyltransferase [Candidatus Ozemobacteraceae bacterium]|nr:RNA methyltransferase [Candidatus Ozemobacteraceae bacterium]
MPSPRRIHRISQALHRRQDDLVVAIERVHDRHNISAILRSADAVGVGHVIWEPDPRQNEEPINPEISKGTERWVQLKVTKKLTRDLRALKKKGYQVAATHLSHRAVDFRSLDWTKKWVVILGNEHAGCSEDVLAEADENIILPMMGLVQSLNVSVATAVLLYEIQRQRENAGMYQRQLPKRTVQKIMKAWRLNDEGYTIEHLLNPPAPEDELPPAHDRHSDGRLRGFSRVRRREERARRRAAVAPAIDAQPAAPTNADRPMKRAPSSAKKSRPRSRR